MSFCVRFINGLFCCTDGKRLILWNPSLEKSLFLPNPRLLNLSCNVAFGFLPSTNIYKIVKISYPKNSDGIKVPPDVEIYDCCTRSWRDVDAEFSYVLDNYNNYPAVLNGIVHWTACNHIGGTFVRLIATFDLGSEKFGDLMLPKSLQNNIKNVSVLKDSLCMIHRDANFTSIFVMKEYGVEESWEKLFIFDSNLRPLYFRENGEILSELISRGHNLVSYDPKTNQVIDLGVHKGPRFFYAYAYVDSLFLIQDSNSQG